MNREVIQYYEDEAIEYDRMATQYFILNSRNPNPFVKNQCDYYMQKANESRLLASWMSRVRIAHIA